MPRCAPRRSGRRSSCHARARSSARSFRVPCARARSFQAASEVLQSDSHDLPATFLQRAKVAFGLSANQTPEAEVLAGNRYLCSCVVDHLDEQTRRRAALVQLAGGVEVARAEPLRHDAVRLVSAVDERLELALAPWIDEGLDRDVARRLRRGEQLVQ